MVVLPVILLVVSASGCSSTARSAEAGGATTPTSAPADARVNATGPATPLETPVVPHPGTSGANRRRAMAASARVLRHFPVPPGSTRIDAPPPRARYLRRLHYFNLPVDQSLTRTRWWLVPRRYDRLVAWYVARTTANRDTTSYHPGGRSGPRADFHWQTHHTSKAFSPPTDVVTYIRLGPHLTAIRTDVTLAARADRTVKTLVPAAVTSLQITKRTIDGTDTTPTTTTITDQASIFAVIAAFDRVRGAYVSTESFGCGDPVGIVHVYAVTFRWPGHTLAVGEGEPLCDVGRKLTLDGSQLPQTLTESHRLNAALEAAYDGA
jgi:hypothetical protein